MNLTHARSLLELRRYDEALAELATVAPEQADAQVHCLRAQAFLGLKRWRDAAASAREATAVAPDGEWGFRLGAIAAMNMGKLGEARTLSQHAVQLAPHLPRAHQVASVVAMNRGEHHGALWHAQHLLQLAPTEAMAHRTYGRALLVSGQIEAAEAPLRHALQLDPQDDEAMALLADVVGTHDKRGAGDLRLDALRSDPHDTDHRNRVLKHGGLRPSVGDYVFIVARRMFFVFAIAAGDGNLPVLVAGYVLLFLLNKLVQRVRARRLPPLVWEGLRDVRRNSDLLWLVIPCVLVTVLSGAGAVGQLAAGTVPTAALPVVAGLMGLALAWRLRAGDLRDERFRDFLRRQRARRFVFNYPRLR